MRENPLEPRDMRENPLEPRDMRENPLYMCGVQGVQPLPLTIGHEVCDGRFLSMKWMTENGLIEHCEPWNIAAANGYLECLDHL